jgi:iron complex outermembrane receptor protein
VSANVNNLNITTNAATSRIYGADVEVTARLSDEFSISANMEVLDAKYQNYPNAPLNVTILNPDGSACLCGFATGTGDLSGGRMPLAPKLTFSISPEYKTEISAGLITLSAHLYYSSKFSGQSSPIIYTKRYATLSLRASFQPVDSNFTFYAWGKNVTDSKYIMGGLITNEGAGVRYARPATYGAGVKYAF